jgi:heterodisulfide reductase subunit C
MTKPRDVNKLVTSCQLDNGLLRKPKAISWHQLNKLLLTQQTLKQTEAQEAIKKADEYGTLVESVHKQGLSANSISEKLSLRELKHLLKVKREREHKQAHSTALEREHKRIVKNSPDLHKNKSKQRYYLYNGILYAKVANKIPARHRNKLKGA